MPSHSYSAPFQPAAQSDGLLQPPSHRLTPLWPIDIDGFILDLRWRNINTFGDFFDGAQRYLKLRLRRCLCH